MQQSNNQAAQSKGGFHKLKEIVSHAKFEVMNLFHMKTERNKVFVKSDKKAFKKDTHDDLNLNQNIKADRYRVRPYSSKQFNPQIRGKEQFLDRQRTRSHSKKQVQKDKQIKFKHGARIFTVENNILSNVSGPILFTAPHSRTIKRGGQRYKSEETESIHQKQILTDYLTPLIAKSAGYQSFCIWGRTKSLKPQKNDLDPNFLLPEMFNQSPFHQCLHKWIEQNGNRPLLHLDIHGKKDGHNDCNIDVGFKATKVFLKGTLTDEIETFLIKEVEPLLRNIKNGKHTCRISCRGKFSGYRHQENHTMAMQAAKLGVVSMQLQLPNVVRSELATNMQLCEAVGLKLRQLYEQVIVKYYKHNPPHYKSKKEIATMFESNIKSKEMVDTLLSQLKHYHGKELMHS